jgi:glycosyltransferase involved in cell wall biosynthesis
MVLPAADLLSSNLPAYLPRDIRCVMRVPMMTRGAYAPARAMEPHLNVIHAVSDRIADDLSGRYRVPSGKISVIYHGVDPDVFTDSLEYKSGQGTVRLLYAGRLWDTDKGIFLLPVMMRELKAAGVDVHLTVAGSGPDGEELKQRFTRGGVLDRVTMTGPVPLDEMNALYRAADIFVFPSRFEGCGFAVLEAMSASCAPVVADIRGSLRNVVDEGRSGQLARVGDGSDFARAVQEIAIDRAKLAAGQRAARQRVLARFTLKQMAANYAGSFRNVLSAPDDRVTSIPLNDYTVPDAFKPTWRTRIPRPLKNIARTWLERLGISS